MTDIVVVDPVEDETPDSDVDVVTTVIIEAPATVEPVAEIADIVEDASGAVELALRVGGLEERVLQLETQSVIPEPVAEPEVTVIEESGPGDVVVVEDESPTKVPWTHKNIFRGRN